MPTVTPNAPHLQWDARTTHANRHARRAAAVQPSHGPHYHPLTIAEMFDILDTLRDAPPVTRYRLICSNTLTRPRT